MLLPKKILRLQSRLGKEELKSRLAAGLGERKRLFRRRESEDRFEGVIDGDTFNINRIIGHRNSFLPVLKGEFKTTTTGTTIEITMGLHKFVKAFMGYFIFVASGMFVLVVGNMITDGALHPAGIMPAAMAVFGIAITRFGFNPEAKKAEALLRKLFEAEPELFG